MNKEKEVKYLVNSLPTDFEDVYHIEQYYFNPKGVEEKLKRIFKLDSLNNISTTRIRKIIHNDDTYYVLTIKSKGLIERDEYEELISEESFNLFLNQEIETKIIKNRYVVHYDDLKFEFDEYLNVNIDGYSLEVEDEDVLNKIDIIEDVLKNHFHLQYKDVTFDNRYKNSNLIKYFGEKE